MNITKHETSHFEDRFDGIVPSFLIVHYTEVDFDQTHAYFTGAEVDEGAGRVSAHYVIDYDGAVHQYVDEDKRAWHAGVASWAEVSTDMNSHSIGIELVNNGDEQFAPDQILSLIKLSQDIMQRHNISASRVLGHDEVAPGRKFDPGPLFPWATVAGEGVGLWPRPLNPYLFKKNRRYTFCCTIHELAPSGR